MPSKPLSKLAMDALVLTQWDPVNVVTVGPKVFRVTDVAVEIARLESGWIPDIRVTDSDDDSYGLWQINLKPGANSLAGLNAISEGKYFLRNPEQLKIASTNAAVAHQLWKQGAGGAGSFAGPWAATYQKALSNLERGNKHVKEPISNVHEGTDPLKGLTDVLSSPFGALNKFFSVLLNPSFWKNLGLGALGVFVLIVAIIFVAGPSVAASKGVTNG